MKQDFCRHFKRVIKLADKRSHLNPMSIYKKCFIAKNVERKRNVFTKSSHVYSKTEIENENFSGVNLFSRLNVYESKIRIQSSR